jgi:glycosyl transferase family 25
VERRDPPVWAISLGRATQRRASVLEAFRRVGIPVSIIEAVDGQELTASQRRVYSPRRAMRQKGRYLTRGEVGCALSHLSVYERLVKEDIPSVLVVEDDVSPSPDLVEILKSLDRLPTDWDVVTLHSLFASARPEPIEGGGVTGRHRVCRYAQMPFGSQCYLINRAGAEKALRVAYPICLPADDLLYRRWPTGLAVYGIEPSPVTAGTLPSEVHADRAPLAQRGLTAAALDQGARWVGRVERRLQGALR